MSRTGIVNPYSHCLPGAPITPIRPEIRGFRSLNPPMNVLSLVNLRYLVKLP